MVQLPHTVWGQKGVNQIDWTNLERGPNKHPKLAFETIESPLLDNRIMHSYSVIASASIFVDVIHSRLVTQTYSLHGHNFTITAHRTMAPFVLLDMRSFSEIPIVSAEHHETGEKLKLNEAQHPGNYTLGHVRSPSRGLATSCFCECIDG